MPSHVPSSEACVPDMLTGTPEQREFQDMILIPGRIFDLADLSPAALAKLAQRQQMGKARSGLPNGQ